jgi:hypothetical protein
MPGEPLAKRPRAAAAATSTAAEAFVVEAVMEAAAARRVLAALQDGLTAQPMALEELWASDPPQAQLVHAHARAALQQAHAGAARHSLPSQARALLGHLSAHAKGSRTTAGGGALAAGGQEASAAAACRVALFAALRAQRTHALAAAAAQGAARCPVHSFPPPGGAKQAALAAAAAARALFAPPHRCAQDGLHFASAASLAEHHEVLEARARERMLSKQQGQSRAWAPPASAWVADGATALAAASGGGAAGESCGDRLGEALGGAEGAAAGGRTVGPGGVGSSSSSSSSGAHGGLGDEGVAMVGASAAPCRLCGEPLETAYDEAREQWRYRGAVQCAVCDDGDDGGGGGSAAENGARETAIVHRACADASATDGAIKRSLLL